MPFADDTTIAEYRSAWEAWQKQLQHLHRVFLEGEPIRPDQLKGLLGRESRAKDRWETARRRLLGLDSPLAEPLGSLTSEKIRSDDAGLDGPMVSKE